MKQLIFIDDSGDPGFKSGSSSNFVMAAALFVDPEVAAILAMKISEYRNSLGWRDDYEFKFTKIRKDIIIELLKIVVKYDFQVYATYVDKADFRLAAPIIDKSKLYDWMIKELLTIMPVGDDVKIEIDGRSGKQNMRKTATYLRKEINKNDDKRLEIKFEDSVDDNLIQLTDLIAGSINRALNNDKTDAGIYIDIFKKRIAVIKKIKQK